LCNSSASISWTPNGLLKASSTSSSFAMLSSTSIKETQDIFLRKMVRFLKPRGYLFLGNAEHIPWLHDILEPLNQTMYRLRELER
jgi:hypothetical protein